MKGFFQSRRLWRIVSGATAAPAAFLPAVGPAAPAANPALDSWLAADKEAQGILVLKIAASLRTGIFVAANNTAAAIWTAIQARFAQQGIAGPYQDFRAAMRCKVGTQNPARDITRLQTHFDRLAASNAAVSAYIQGMMLLDALPYSWDNIGAAYVQATTTVAGVSFDTICGAILTESNRQGGTKADRTHIADRLSAVKRKGKSPQFSNQKKTNDHRPASDEAGPSNPQKRRRNRPNRGKTSSASHQHSHVASMACNKSWTVVHS
jgi:hypothetical protein